MLNNESINYEAFEALLKGHNIKLNKKDFNSTLNILSSDYYREGDKKKYGNIYYLTVDEKMNVRKSEAFIKMLKSEVYKSELEDILAYAEKRALLKDNEVMQQDNLVLSGCKRNFESEKQQYTGSIICKKE